MRETERTIGEQEWALGEGGDDPLLPWQVRGAGRKHAPVALICRPPQLFP
jgi:hypothetical protein